MFGDLDATCQSMCQTTCIETRIHCVWSPRSGCLQSQCYKYKPTLVLGFHFKRSIREVAVIDASNEQKLHHIELALESHLKGKDDVCCHGNNSNDHSHFILSSSLCNTAVAISTELP